MYAPRRRRRRRCGDPLRCLFYYTLRVQQIHLGYAGVIKKLNVAITRVRFFFIDGHMLSMKYL